MDIGWSTPGTDYITQRLASGATTQSVTTTNPTGATTAVPNTGNPGNNPAAPPNGVDHWQGGAPNPTGPTTPSAGGRWVDPTYKTDATGRPLSDAESAAWRDYDRRRAESASILRSNNPGKPAATTGGPGVDAPLYDAETQTYSYKDKDGKWTHGVSAADIYAQLDSDVQKVYPSWYFGQYAKTQDAAHRSTLDAAAFDNQTFATRGSQTTRYAPTNF